MKTALRGLTHPADLTDGELARHIADGEFAGTRCDRIVASVLERIKDSGGEAK